MPQNILLPFGKYRDKPLHEVGTAYLLFMASQTSFAVAYPEIVRAFLVEAAERIRNLDKVMTELADASLIKTARQRRWESAQCKAEKLRQLEGRRARVEQHRQQRIALLKAELLRRQRAADPAFDGSDLV